MTTYVVDASIVIKWVVAENGTAEALKLRRHKLLAPELLVAECANILWKKVQRTELLQEEAFLAARLLQGADIEFSSTRSLLETSTRIAVELDHPAYDCLYLALAVENSCRLVTADDHLLNKIRQGQKSRFSDSVMALAEV